MTDPTPESQQSEPESAPMPRWVPVLIGGILVLMAALAVYTGLRDRDNDITAHVRPQRDPVMNAAPPGEPGPGESLVMHGGEGDTPAAHPPVEGDARAVIRGGPGGVESTVRIWARRGMLLEITPAESMVYVNDLPIGHASQFDTMDEVYDFPAPGSYTVKVVSPDNQQKVFIVTAADDAKQGIARIAAKFE